MFYVDIRYVYIYSYMLGFYADGTCVSISFYIYTNMYLHKLHIYRSHTHYTYDYYIHIIYIMLYTYYDVLCTYYTTIIHIAYIYKLHVHTDQSHHFRRGHLEANATSWTPWVSSRHFCGVSPHGKNVRENMGKWWKI